MVDDLLPYDLEPQLILIHQLNDMPSQAIKVPKPTIKGQKMGGGPIPGNSCLFLKILEIILLLISL